jgi:hypothetical protein
LEGIEKPSTKIAERMFTMIMQLNRPIVSATLPAMIWPVTLIRHISCARKKTLV